MRYSFLPPHYRVNNSHIFRLRLSFFPTSQQLMVASPSAAHESILVALMWRVDYVLDTIPLPESILYCRVLPNDYHQGVTTVTTRDSRRLKTHAKPTQVHASGRERVQPPNGTPASEQATQARSLLVLFFVKSTLALYLLYLDRSLSSRLIGIHMYPSTLRPSCLTFYD